MVLLDYFFFKKNFSVCSSQISRFNHANRFRNSNSSTSCFLIKTFFSKKKNEHSSDPYVCFSRKKNKISLSPKIPCEMCMHELLLGSSPNYEKQIGAMTQSMSIPLLPLSLPASLFFPKISCKYSLSVSQFCLYRAPTAHQSSHPRGRESEKINKYLLRSPQITISSVLAPTIFFS